MILRMLFGSGVVLGGFILGLVLFAPLEKTLGLVPLQEQGIQVYAPEGRVLSGHVARLQAGGQTLDDVHWWLKPGWLLTGQIGGQVALRYGPNTQVRGQVKLRPGGDIRLSDLSATGLISDFKPMLRLPFLPVEGRLRLNLEEARLRDGRPVGLEGALYIEGLNWSLQKPPLPLGNFVLDISTDEAGAILGALRDQNASVAAAGNLSLSPEGRYQLDARITPTSKAPPVIRNSLAALGQPDSGGAYPLKYQGQIPNW